MLFKCVGRCCCSKWKDLKCCGSLAFSFVSILFSSTSKRIYNGGPLFVFVVVFFTCVFKAEIVFIFCSWLKRIDDHCTQYNRKTVFPSNLFLVWAFFGGCIFALRWVLTCIIIFPRCICFWLNLRLPFNAIILPVYICIWLNLSLTHFAFWRCNNIGCLTVFGKFYFVPLQRE